MSTVPTPQTRTAAEPGVWQHCSVRYPVVTTRWSSVHDQLCAAHSSPQLDAASRIECSIILEMTNGGDGRAVVVVLLSIPGETPDVPIGPLIELARHDVDTECSIDDAGLLHLDFRRNGETDRILTLSVDRNDPGRLHYVRTLLLSEVGLPAGGYEQPFIENASFNSVS